MFNTFSELVLDYTGTLSVDGRLLPGIAERLTALAQSFCISVITSNTFGTAKSQLDGIPVQLIVMSTGEAKLDIVRQICPAKVTAIGNGRNDVPMMREAGLRNAVIGQEGAAAELLQFTNIVVTDICHALDLIINPLRLKKRLRDWARNIVHDNEEKLRF
ncbi:ATPase P [candidate division KSB1 bacterium]|nr:ATPase P [candidate division KSB1 bacterium]